MNEYIIQYTTTDCCIINPSKARAFGGLIISNTYEDGIGRIVLDSPATKIADSTFECCDNLKTIIIPKSVRIIENKAFCYCGNLEHVGTYDGELSTIGHQAFDSCTRLKNFKIPKGVTTINSYAFYNCEHLDDIVIPDGVSLIEHGAFSGCKKIKSIVIPQKTKLNGNAFRNCESLVRFYGKYASDNGRCLIVDGELRSFAGRDIYSYTIPNGVISIGCGAFAYSNISSIEISNSVKYIDAFAFEGCSNLSEVSMPDSVTNIDIDAFEGCNNIKKVYITDLGKWSEIQFGPTWASNPMYSGALLLLNRKLIIDLVIPESISSINSMAFCGCLNIRSIILPSSIKSIDSEAFYGCENLEDITIANNILSIGDYAFCECYNLNKVCIMSVIPPQGGDNMFPINNSLKIYVPAESIDMYKKAEYWSDYTDNIVECD